MRQFSYDPNGNRSQYQVEELSEPLTYAPQSNRLTQRGSEPITLDASGRVTNDGQIPICLRLRRAPVRKHG